MRVIERENLERLQADTDLVLLIGGTVALQRRGYEYVGLCPFHQEKTPSFTVSPKGFFHCFGCGAHGRAIDWLMRAGGMTFRDAVSRLEDKSLGPLPGPQPKRQPDSARLAEAERDREGKRRAALTIWESGRPARGTVVERYLQERGINDGVPPVLRFHPALKHGPTGLLLPAMLAQVQAVDGSFLGVHRTYLRMDGRGKALVSEPRRTLGTISGGAIRLAPVREKIGLGEGIETCLSVAMVADFPVWSCIAATFLPKVNLPKEIRTVVLFGDADTAGRVAVEKAAEKLTTEGRTVSVAFPPAGCKDFNDALNVKPLEGAR